MKMYFLKGVDEPLEFGDTLEFDIVKNGDDNQTVTKHIKCQFQPAIIPLLLEEEVITEKEELIDVADDTKEENTFSMDDFVAGVTTFIHETADTLEYMNKRLADLEKRYKTLAAPPKETDTLDDEYVKILKKFFEL